MPARANLLRGFTRAMRSTPSGCSRVARSRVRDRLPIVALRRGGEEIERRHGIALVLHGDDAGRVGDRHVVDRCAADDDRVEVVPIRAIRCEVPRENPSLTESDQHDRVTVGAATHPRLIHRFEDGALVLRSQAREENERHVAVHIVDGAGVLHRREQREVLVGHERGQRLPVLRARQHDAPRHGSVGPDDLLDLDDALVGAALLVDEPGFAEDVLQSVRGAAVALRFVRLHGRRLRADITPHAHQHQEPTMSAYAAPASSKRGMISSGARTSAAIDDRFDRRDRAVCSCADVVAGAGEGSAGVVDLLIRLAEASVQRPALVAERVGGIPHRFRLGGLVLVVPEIRLDAVGAALVEVRTRDRLECGRLDGGEFDGEGLQGGRCAAVSLLGRAER